MVDDKEYGPYQRVQGLTFAGDGSGKHLFGYTAVSADDSMAVYVDGQLQPLYTSIYGPVFSDDGNHLAYIGERDHRWSYLVRDGQESKLENMPGMPPTFSPDGKHLAWLSRVKTGTFVWLDAARVFDTESFISENTIHFTPDSGNLVIFGDASLHVRGKVVADYPRAYWRYAFTPDGTLAYVRYTDDGKQRVVVGDHAYPPVDGTVSGLTISPRGDILYAAHQWTPDGTRTGKSRVDIYVNEALHGSYEIMLPFPYDIQQRFFFDAPDRVHYFAIRDGVIHRVEVAL